MKVNLAKVNVDQPVFSRIIPDHEVLNQSLKLLIEDYRASNPKSNKTNVKAWHTHYMLHRVNQSSYLLLIWFMDI